MFESYPTPPLNTIWYTLLCSFTVKFLERSEWEGGRKGVRGRARRNRTGVEEGGSEGQSQHEYHGVEEGG